MIDRGKRSVLGVRINVVNYESAVEQIINAAHAKKSLSVSALAVHGVMTGALDPEHKYRLNRLDLLAPDGQPVRWALRFLHGERLADRVYGPRLTELVLERAAREGIPVGFYGSSQEVLAAMRDTFENRYRDINIAHMEPSKFRLISSEEEANLRARVHASGAQIVFVGLGCPRQEVFVYEHARALGLPVLAVGAAFDFHAGSLRQAPVWMQDRGLEWLFRLAMEPRRLWRRYLYLNPLYLVMIAGQKFGLLHRQFADEREPREKLRYG